MLTINLLFILLLLITIVLISSCDTFVVYNKELLLLQSKLKKLNKLEKRITKPGDSKNLRIKKMIHHYLKPLESYNPLGDIANVKMPNGCINFQEISLNMFGTMIEKLNEKKIKKEIAGILNDFKKNYSFMMDKYYKFPISEYSTDITIDFGKQTKPEPGDDFTKYMNNVVLNSMKYAIKELKPKMNTTQLVVYKPELIINKIKEGINLFDFEGFPKEINVLLQDLSKKQCQIKNKCCI